MAEPYIVNSRLSRSVRVDGIDFRIQIYRLEGDAQWVLEVVDKDGTSTVWDDQFDSDQVALEEALMAIREEGAASFMGQANVVPFPRKGK